VEWKWLQRYHSHCSLGCKSLFAKAQKGPMPFSMLLLLCGLPLHFTNKFSLQKAMSAIPMNGIDDMKYFLFQKAF
jgi:hypothetical protein